MMNRAAVTCRQTGVALPAKHFKKKKKEAHQLYLELNLSFEKLVEKSSDNPLRVDWKKRGLVK